MSEPKRPMTAIRLLRTLQTPASGPAIDYLTMRTPSPRLILPNGRYDAGWFDDFKGELNVERSSAGRWRFQRWLHIHFDTGRYFVAANVAHMSLAGNTSIVALDRETGRFHEASRTRMLWRNPVEVDPEMERFLDTESGSSIAMTRDGVAFDIRLDGLRFEGTAEAVFERPFSQVTRYHGGAGTLQWWGNLSLDRATLTLDGQARALPPGALGAYDRSVGHRRPIQNWNWLAAVGQARDAETGEPVVLSLLASTDQALARPRISASKNNVWIDGQHLKLPEMTFRYDVIDADTWDTGPWTLTSQAPNARLALRFTPQHRRRERRHTPLLVDVDFNQYYGPLSGRVEARGRVLEVDGMFGLVEDSWMVM